MLLPSCPMSEAGERELELHSEWSQPRWGHKGRPAGLARSSPQLPGGLWGQRSVLAEARGVVQLPAPQVLTCHRERGQ